MSVPLEDFGDVPASPHGNKSVTGGAPDPSDAIRVAGYEAGYKSGWDDAAAAAESDRTAIGAELARNLRDLSFTYFEARDEMLSALEPFLSSLFDALFPELLPESTASAIASELKNTVQEACNGETLLEAAEEDCEAVQAILEGADIHSVKVRPEPALASGQVRLRVGPRSVFIDTNRLVTQLKDALTLDVAPVVGPDTIDTTAKKESRANG